MGLLQPLRGPVGTNAPPLQDNPLPPLPSAAAAAAALLPLPNSWALSLVLFICEDVGKWMGGWEVR